MLLTRVIKQSDAKQSNILPDQLNRLRQLTNSTVPCVEFWLGYISSYSSLKNSATQNFFTFNDWNQLSQAIKMALYAELQKLINIQNVYELIIYSVYSQISVQYGGANIIKITQSIKQHLGELTADNQYLKVRFFSEGMVKLQKNSKIGTQQKKSKQKLIQQQKNFNKQQSIGLGIQCSICLEEVTLETVCPVSCGHNLHRNCLVQHFRSKVEVKKFPITCPQSGCNIQIKVTDLEEYIPKELLQKFYQFSFHQFVDKNKKNTNWCPTPGCKTVFSYDGQLTDYNCLGCKKNYCLKCKTQSHSGISCQQNRNMKDLPQEEKQFINAAQGLKMKQCPSCKFWVQKNKGCDHITCRCGYQFCFRCGAKYGQGACHCDEHDSFYGDDDDEEQQQREWDDHEDHQPHSSSFQQPNSKEQSNSQEGQINRSFERIRNRMPIFLGRGRGGLRRIRNEIGIRIGSIQDDKMQQQNPFVARRQAGERIQKQQEKEQSRLFRIFRR